MIYGNRATYGSLKGKIEKNFASKHQFFKINK